MIVLTEYHKDNIQYERTKSTICSWTPKVNYEPSKNMYLKNIAIFRRYNGCTFGVAILKLKVNYFKPFCLHAQARTGTYYNIWSESE